MTSRPLKPPPPLDLPASGGLTPPRESRARDEPSSGREDEARTIDTAMPHADTIAAAVAAIGDSTRRTIEQDPRATIEPERSKMDSAIRTAMRSLSRVSLSPQSLGAGTIRVEKTLGEGGMGVVRLGVQPSLARSVAVKSLKPDQRNDSTALRLLREAWVTGSLEHPNVVPVYDLAVDDENSPVIVLKRIEGTSWNALMFARGEIKRRFRADDALEWNLGVLMQVCNAVHFAHSRGIVHRDLKPENVMIGNFGEVYLLDWGIAVSMSDDPEGRLPRASDATQLAGTMCYMAPEMLGEDPPRISPRTDVYLLGAVLFEIVTGRPPHDGESFMEMMSKVLVSEPDLAEDTDPEIARILRRALAREPDARFESAEQFRLALSGFLHHRGSRRLATEAIERLTELEGLITRPDAAGAEMHAEIHHLFGEVQFGLQQAVAAWHENEPARTAMERALVTMARHELTTGDAAVAAHLIEQAPNAPAELRTEIASAAQKQRAERERLERLAQDADNTIGRRTRLALAAMLGSLWTVAPVVSHFLRDLVATHLSHLLMPVALAVPAALLGAWAKETLSRTEPNRILRRIVIATLAGQFVLQLGLWYANMPLPLSMSMNFVVWGWGAAAVAIAIEPLLWIAVAAYVAGFFVSLRFPDVRFLVAAGSNFILMLAAVKAWRMSREEWQSIAAKQRARFAGVEQFAQSFRRRRIAGAIATAGSAAEEGPARSAASPANGGTTSP